VAPSTGVGLRAKADRVGGQARLMWLDDIDLGGRGICRPAVGPLGRALRGARLDQFLSQERLAEVAGVHQTQVSRLELGAPKWALFCHLVKTLGGHPVVTIEPLTKEDEEFEKLRRLAATVW
jgi:DNA-binding XRE family transcriptional regulator